VFSDCTADEPAVALPVWDELLPDLAPLVVERDPDRRFAVAPSPAASSSDTGAALVSASGATSGTFAGAACDDSDGFSRGKDFAASEGSSGFCRSTTSASVAGSGASVGASLATDFVFAAASGLSTVSGRFFSGRAGFVRPSTAGAFPVASPGPAAENPFESRGADEDGGGPG
jgi:hypothetical protein